MKTKKIISKGYTISAVSWENDGDNYKTRSIVVETKELAIAISKMCKELFASCNRTKATSIGNGQDYKKSMIIVLDYMLKHPEVYENVEICDEELISLCMDYNYSLLGSCEDYDSRVCESVEIYYSPEDVLLEIIEF